MLRNNRLTEFPAHLPADLPILILHNNRLRALPAQLPEDLVFFDVHSNRLTTLPEPLPLLLQYSDFTDNPLNYVPTRFPLQYPKWHNDEHRINLTEVLLDWVHERYITADEYNGRLIAEQRIKFCINNHSRSLDLSGLHLTRLPTHLPANITELRINNNQLSVLPTN